MPSYSCNAFALAIQDAENMLKHFNALNTKPPPPENEVLKRAGLIMAMTAWETYVEDRVREAATVRLSVLNDSAIGAFVTSKLKDEIKRLNNPNAEKTLQLFREYAGVDLEDKWCWNNFTAPQARERLNQLLKLRGDVVHRSRPFQPGPPVSHAVRKDELEKAIRFIKDLVSATENALSAAN